MKQAQGKSGLWRRRECRCLTWRGWLVLVLAVSGLSILFIWSVYPFLAVNDPVPGGLLVVEGWAPDYALQQTVAEYRHNHYRRIFVTGGPLSSGGPLSEYKSYAELGAAVLLRLGLTTNDVQAVPAPPVAADRTYTSAVNLRNWLRDHGVTETNINILTLGAHARRTRLMFEDALGTNYRVGVVALPYEGFDPAHWWRSSEGVRTVTGEAIGYGYARFLFRPPSPEPGGGSSG